MPQSGNRIVTEQIDFSEGVDSGRVATIASVRNPNGLRPTQVAWINNGTCRGGGIRTRAGWNRILQNFIGDTGLFQGGAFYAVPGIPTVPAGYPYLMFMVSGQLYILRIQPTVSLTTVDMSITGLNPVAQTKCYFCQAEEFMIIQADDFVTQPLVWDGLNLYRITAFPGFTAHMLPPGKAMDYFQGRVWVQSNEREYMAGDTVKASSGTVAYGFRDAILHSTENSYLVAGGAFTVPSTSGSIRSIEHTTNLDSALGESNLFISTRNTIYSVTAPQTRQDWLNIDPTSIAAGKTSIKQTVAMKRFGVVSDRSVVVSNGDMFFRGYDGIRSLYMAVRYFQQWGQTPISNNVQRVLDRDDRALIHYASGIEFDNRLLETCLPVQTPVGVGFQAIAVLDFDLLTSLQEKKAPAWEGVYEGLDFLQLFESDFGGLQRAFAAVHSRVTDKIEIWELTSTAKAENGDNRITMVIETPAYTWEDQRQWKMLDNAEFWIDQIFGTVDLDFYFRPDGDPCWTLWYHTQVCAARSSCELPVPICGYLEQPYCSQDRIPIVLPSAPGAICAPGTKRPVNLGYQFQVRIVGKGRFRLRGIWVWAMPREKPPYEGLIVYPAPAGFPAQLPQ